MAMAEFPALPIWTDAFLADTIHLDNAETGSYMMLLICAWRDPDNSLPDDDKRLARFARCGPKKWQSIKPTIMSFWHLQDGRWRQKKLDIVRLEVTKRRETFATRGRLGGLAKSLKNNKPDLAEGVLKPCLEPSNQNQNQIKDNLPKSVRANGHAVDPPLTPEKFPVKKALENWNIAAEAYGLPLALSLTEGRKRKIRARLQEHGLEGWILALEQIGNSAFLRGTNDRHWRLSLDSLLRPDNFVKLMEGGYADE